MATYRNDIFKFQTRGLETWMASIPRTSISFLYFFFRSLAQPIAGHIQKKENAEIIAGEMNNFLVSFLYFSGLIAVGLNP